MIRAIVTVDLGGDEYDLEFRAPVLVERGRAFIDGRIEVLTPDVHWIPAAGVLSAADLDRVEEALCDEALS